LPFSDRSFDLVIGIRLLAHVVAWRELLAEMSRVSRRLVLVDYPREAVLHRLAPALFRAKRRVEGNTRPYFQYAVDEVGRAFEALGLRVSGVSAQFSLPMVLHRAMGRPRISQRLEWAAGQLGLTRRFGSPVLMLAERARSVT